MSALARGMMTGGAIGLVTLTAVRAQSAGPSSPPHRRHHAIAYDPATRRVLLYGGQHLVDSGPSAALDDLWSWDGKHWALVAAHTGAAMLAHSLFADGAGTVFARGAPAGSTSKWDGKRWQPVATDTTSYREMAAGAYDTRRRRYVLFGGHLMANFPPDTRELEGRSWTVVAIDGPTARLGASMAYDQRRQRCVLFGGIAAAGERLGDTWTWDGKAWTRLTVEGPSARFGAGMAFDGKRGDVILFGGADSANRKLADTWRWNGSAWSRIEVAEAPEARTEGYLAYDEARGVIVMFGGEGAKTIPTLGDTWEWNGTRWTRVR